MGCCALVCGLGTRAVDRADNDYPRMVALSHPHLRPETRVEQMRQYSQHLIDMLDLEDNTFKTLPIRQVIGGDFPALRLVASQDTGQYRPAVYHQALDCRPGAAGVHLRYAGRGRDVHRRHAQSAGDARTTLRLPGGHRVCRQVTKTYPRPQFHISLLQCRPLTAHESKQTRHIPSNISPERQAVFGQPAGAGRGGRARALRGLCQARTPTTASPTPQRRLEVGRLVGRINERLKDEEFVLMGPGRWGTSDIQLGRQGQLRGHFQHARADRGGVFSQRRRARNGVWHALLSRIWSKPRFTRWRCSPDEQDVCFNWDFFNRVAQCAVRICCRTSAKWADVVTVIDVPAVQRRAAAGDRDGRGSRRGAGVSAVL